MKCKEPRLVNTTQETRWKIYSRASRRILRVLSLSQGRGYEHKDRQTDQRDRMEPGRLHLYSVKSLTDRDQIEKCPEQTEPV